MVSTFINPLVNPEANLGVSRFDETAPIQLWQNHSEADVELVIRAAYRQVLGNAHVMESERLTVAESQLKQSDISVREFVRQIALSEQYRARFFEPCPRMRSIELNFKHLLGRAPESAEEMADHAQLLDRGGFEMEINNYIDSDEYQDAFGEDTVPYYRGHKTQTGKKMVGFTHMFQLLRGSASSDKDPTHKNRSRLNSSILRNRPSAIAALKGAPPVWQRPAAITDVNQLLSKVFGLKRESPDLSFKPVAPKTSNAPERQQQFYDAYQPFKETAPVESYAGSSDADLDVVIRAVYRQVFGNAHVMESERLTVTESQFKRGELSVREFVRQLAKSEFYRSRFFDSCYRYRAIELNFKHLLGRAPDNFDEMRCHSSVLDQKGFEADIDTYIDSDEYQTAFGEAIVPYYRGFSTQNGQSMLEFTNMFQLLRSASSSDKDLATNNKPQLTRAIVQNSPYGKLKVSDVEAILAEVFKPKTSGIGASQSWATSANFAAEQALRQTLLEQDLIIESLQKQLTELRPSAAIGASYIKTAWQPSVASVQGDPSDSLLQQSDNQLEQIANLQSQIADARRYAAIGDARLNKWRSRVFNS
jgi:phycobilisome core-membrane linker protein